MSKTFGEKKQKYSNHHNQASLNKPVRNYVKSFLNHIKIIKHLYLVGC